MPVEKGRAWGTPSEIPGAAIPVESDAQARAVLEEARSRRRPLPPLLLRGGDLCRTLGGGADREPAGVSFPVDLGEALIDGRHCLFLAHLVARSPLWGRAFVAMNAQWLGPWNLGPRAHPGDGLLDSYDIRLPPSQRLAVRARLAHGIHLPHPGIREHRTAAGAVELERPVTVRADGTPVGRGRVISVRVEPDALTVFV